MRTDLLKRLKPNVRQGLENSRTRYPEIITNIEFSLSQQVFYTDLTISQISSIFTFADIESYDRSAWNWKFGEDLFTECNGCV